MTDARTGPAPSRPVPTVALIGGGLIGTSWAALFAAAGQDVRLHDHDPAVRDAAPARIAAALGDLGAIAPLSRPAAPVRITGTLEEAVAGADHVQECIVESVPAKTALFARIRAAAPAAVIASSTSTFPPSALFSGIDGRERTLVAHPLLPPHLIPVSELVPAPFTAPETMERTAALLASAGHRVIPLHRETPGFVLNRLQFAILGEAMHLVDTGVCAPEDIDTAIRSGLGLRWAAIGLFANTHLNAAGGARGSLGGYRAAIGPVLASLRPAHPWSDTLLDTIDAAMRRSVPDAEITSARAGRDARLVALRRLMAGTAPVGP